MPSPPPDPAPLRRAAAPGDGAPSYERLADVFHDVLAEDSLDRVLERIADTLSELIPYDDLHIYEADEGGRTLRALFARGPYADEVLADVPFRFGQGITGHAVEQRTPVLANRAHLDPRVRFVADTPMDPEALVVVPLVARGRLNGALNVYRVGEQEFTEEEFRLVVRFGDAAALALDNARIRASLEQQAQTDALTGLLNHRAFHERLRTALLDASATHGRVALVMLDLDDFKRVNDVFGHAAGDEVLVEIADELRSSVRTGDAVCRIGGEEFAVIAPDADAWVAQGLGDRIAQRVRSAAVGPAGTLGVSVGIAMGPEHATSPRSLVACAEAAMMTAKARGKNQVVMFDETASERPDAPVATRSLAHLKLLQSVSGKLGRLNDVSEIGATIADELRGLMDYHNCRIFLRDDDDLRPIAFRGDLTASAPTTLEALATRVGVGVTGRVAETGEPLIVPDAARCEFGHHIEGTATIEESLLAVPLRYGSLVVGVIVVSQLGLDQFDADDQRLLELLAGHASVALANARLYEAQRREAESAKALLGLSRELSSVNELAVVLPRVARATAAILHADHASVWLPAQPPGELECRAAWWRGPALPGLLGTRLPYRLLGRLAPGAAPCVVDPGGLDAVVDVVGPLPEPLRVAVAPFAFDGMVAAIAVGVSGGGTFDERALDLLEGIASQAKLAITNARSFESLETTFLSTIEALATALEAKDDYTSHHTRWITDMAILVARELELDADAVKRVELGALFHDIGKIGIPHSILAKPGPLTEEERVVVETHPGLGERILAPIERLADVRPIVRACHERWDGGGYPDGLAGDAIPSEARIVFVCDAYHAMTTDRPYRSALPVAEARRRLREGAGSQFDPQVVEACLRVLDRSSGAPPQH